MELRRKRAPPSPPKPASRLQPSEPLHMTTRAASKAASNGSNSRRGSLVSNGGHNSPVASYDDTERYPKRRRVSNASVSKTTPIRGSQSSHSLSTASRPSTRSMSNSNLPPIAETPSIAKKRKRSSDSSAESMTLAPVPRKYKTETAAPSYSSSDTKKQPLRKAKTSSTSSEESIGSKDADIAADEAQLELNKANEAREYEAEVAAADVDGEAEVEVETDDDDDDDDDDNADITKQAHEAVGEITNGSISQPELANGKKASHAAADEGLEPEESQGISTKKHSNVSDTSSEGTQVSANAANEESFIDIDASMEQDDEQEQDDEPEEENEEVEEEDADADADPEELPEEVTISLETLPMTVDPTPAESAQASPAGSPPDSSLEQESPIKRAVTSFPGDLGLDSKGKKKLPGRRRAPHANPKVEAALRRQLHLRMNYRAVAKALKPILAELGNRSLREIHADPKSHEQASEFSGVKEGLHQHFEGRLAWISKQKELSKKRLDDMFETEMEARKSTYKSIARNMQEQHIIRLQHDFLSAVRQHEREDDGHASDDENEDVIPPLHHVTAKGVVSNVLGPEYHWRSRPAMIIEKLFDELYQRHEVVRDRRDHNEQPDFAESRPFTTLDPTLRESVLASKNIGTLMQALEEAQRVPIIPPPPPIPNHEAYGLLALANASAVNAATDAAMREAEERAKIQEEAMAKARKEQEELKRASPLSVPKPSMSQPPEDQPKSATRNVPTPVQTPRSEHRWPVEAPRPEQKQQEQEPKQEQKQEQKQEEKAQQQLQQQPPSQQLPPQQYQQSHQPLSRPPTTFSQVALNPSITETAPLIRLPGLSQPLPRPIIPGLSFIHQIPGLQQIPGLGNPPPPSIPGLNTQKPPTPKPSIREPSVTRHSQTPSTHFVPPVHVANAPAPSHQSISQQQHKPERSTPSRPQEPFAPHVQTPATHIGPPSQSASAGKDFWSSLARGAKENGTSKTRLAPKDSSQAPSPAVASGSVDFATSYSLDNSRALESQSHPLGGRFQDGPLESHPLGRGPDRPQDHAPVRPSERPLGANQDKASSRPQSTASATVLEPLLQRLQSATELFGPPYERESPKPAKRKTPVQKTSLHGGYPRGRNYDGFKHERRASVTTASSHEGQSHMHSRPSGPPYGQTPDSRQAPFHTATQHQARPAFPVSAPPQGSYQQPHHQYTAVRHGSYGYDQHASPYGPSPYGPPTGFSSLPGPPPMTQAPSSTYYQGHPPPQTYQQQQAPYAPPPPPPPPPQLAARPPTSQAAYGQQYRGQPILPAASGPGGYGPNGQAHGPLPAGPAFAQYPHQNEGRRHEYGRGGRGGRHSGGHAEFKQWHPR